jgi:hypothetical protein
MLRFVFGLLICLGLCCAALLADTPGEEAVKDAIKTLKAKRAAVKDKADQALLDTAIKDLEERLAQVGKGEPEPEPEGKKGDLVMPKNWELKFNTGKSKPSFDPKTGILKLSYDFSDPKQLKDFTFATDVKPTVQKGVLKVKGGDELRHVVNFKTVSVSVTIVSGDEHECPLRTSGNYWLAVTGRDQTFVDTGHGQGADRGIAGKGLGRRVHGNNTPLILSDWFIGETKVGFKAGNIEASGKKKSAIEAGYLILTAYRGNQFSKMTISGTVDAEWAKEFFADKE